ncbi:MAG: hypothetical protein AAF569_00500 [Pseudomonadota bacterium]
MKKPDYSQENYTEEEIKQMEQELHDSEILDPEFDNFFDDIPFDYPCIYFPKNPKDGEE